MIIDSQLELLSQISLFEGFTPEETESVAQCLSLLSLPKNTNLLVADQRGEVVYFILEGTVKVYIESSIKKKARTQTEARRSVTLNVQGKGEVLGEINALDPSGHSANVMTLEPSSMLWMSKSDFLRLEQEIPQFSLNLSRLLAKRLRLLSSHVFAAGTMNVEQRVAYHIYSLVTRYNAEEAEVALSAKSEKAEAKASGKTTKGRAAVKAAHEPIAIPLRLQQGDLADIVGASRIQVNAALGILKRDGVIRMGGRGDITVLNLPELADRAE